MTAPTLLLSDLHLPNSPSPLRTRFHEFLTRRATGALAVYLLGDLFEYWIGDDIGMDDYDAEIADLRSLTESGVRVYFLHGNRDFFVGGRFAKETGVIILPDPVRIDLNGTPTLLSHGDLYCTDDEPYMRWRELSRNVRGQRAFLSFPRFVRERIADTARRRSGSHKRMQSAGIMDVNERAIRNAFREYDVQRLIHGHTHRPGSHTYAIDGRTAERIVLADWRPDRQDVLVSDDRGLHSASAAGPG